MMYVVRCGIPQSVRRSLLTARYHSCKSIVVAGPGFLTSQPSPIKYSPQSRVVSTSSSTRHLRAGSVVAPVRTLRRAVLVDRSAYLGALRSLSSCESPLHVRISPTPARFSIVIRCAGIGLGVACLLTTVLKTCLLFLAARLGHFLLLYPVLRRHSLPIIIVASAPLCTRSLPQPCTGALTVAIPR
jgi:hypothetical protein